MKLLRVLSLLLCLEHTFASKIGENQKNEDLNYKNQNARKLGEIFKNNMNQFDMNEKLSIKTLLINLESTYENNKTKLIIKAEIVGEFPTWLVTIQLEHLLELAIFVGDDGKFEDLEVQKLVGRGKQINESWIWNKAMKVLIEAFFKPWLKKEGIRKIEAEKKGGVFNLKETVDPILHHLNGVDEINRKLFAEKLGEFMHGRASHFDKILGLKIADFSIEVFDSERLKINIMFEHLTAIKDFSLENLKVEIDSKNLAVETFLTIKTSTQIQESLLRSDGVSISQLLKDINLSFSGTTLKNIDETNLKFLEDSEYLNEALNPILRSIPLKRFLLKKLNALLSEQTFYIPHSAEDSERVSFQNNAEITENWRENRIAQKLVGFINENTTIVQSFLNRSNVFTKLLHPIYCRYTRQNSVHFQFTFENAGGDLVALESDLILNLLSDALGIYTGARVKNLQDEIDVFRMSSYEKNLVWPVCIDVQKSKSSFDIWLGFDEESDAQYISDQLSRKDMLEEFNKKREQILMHAKNTKMENLYRHISLGKMMKIENIELDLLHKSNEKLFYWNSLGVEKLQFQSLKVDAGEKGEFDVNAIGAVEINSNFDIPALNSKIKLNLSLPNVQIDLKIGISVADKEKPSSMLQILNDPTKCIFGEILQEFHFKRFTSLLKAMNVDFEVAPIRGNDPPGSLVGAISSLENLINRNKPFFRSLLSRSIEDAILELNPIFNRWLQFDCPMPLRETRNLEDLTKPLFFWNKMVIPEHFYKQEVEKYTDFSDLGHIALKHLFFPTYCNSSNDVCDLEISKTKIQKEFAADEWFNEKLERIQFSLDEFKVSPLTIQNDVSFMFDVVEDDVQFTLKIPRINFDFKTELIGRGTGFQNGELHRIVQYQISISDLELHLASQVKISNELMDSWNSDCWPAAMDLKLTKFLPAFKIESIQRKLLDGSKRAKKQYSSLNKALQSAEKIKQINDMLQKRINELKIEFINHDWSKMRKEKCTFLQKPYEPQKLITAFSSWVFYTCLVLIIFMLILIVCWRFYFWFFSSTNINSKNFHCCCDAMCCWMACLEGMKEDDSVSSEKASKSIELKIKPKRFYASLESPLFTDLKLAQKRSSSSTDVELGKRASQSVGNEQSDDESNLELSQNFYERITQLTGAVEITPHEVEKFWYFNNILIYENNSWLILLFGLVMGINLFLLFLSHYLSEVKLSFALEFGGDSFEADPAYNLNFLGLICLLFRGGVYGKILGVLLTLTCFIWPYIRLYLLLSCAFLPWQRQSRGKCLEWLDFFGKWSLSGFYAFTILLLVGNRDFISEHSILYTPTFYGYYVKSKPLVGAYIGLAAILLSHILNSVLIYLHRHKELEYHRKKHGLARRVRKIQFYDKDLSEKFTISKCGSIFVFVMLAGAALLLILSFMCPPMFKVEERTLFSPEWTANEYSILLSSIHLSNNPDLSALWIIFVILATFVPILTIIVAFILWRYHLSTTCQRRMFYLVEILASFSNLEVFVASAVGAIHYFQYIGDYFSDIEISRSITALFALGPFVDVRGELHKSTGFILPAAAVVWCVVIYSISILINRVLLPQSFTAKSIEWFERCGILLRTKKKA